MGKHQKTSLSSIDRERIEKEVKRTGENIARLKSSMESEFEPSSGEQIGDDVDVAYSIHEREKTLAVIGTLAKKLQALEHALEIEQKGTYGICEECGQRISSERLEILPEASLCVKCQSRADRF